MGNKEDRDCLAFEALPADSQGILSRDFREVRQSNRSRDQAHAAPHILSLSPPASPSPPADAPQTPRRHPAHGKTPLQTGRSPSSGRHVPAPSAAVAASTPTAAGLQTTAPARPAACNALPAGSSHRENQSGSPGLDVPARSPSPAADSSRKRAARGAAPP